MGTSYHYPGWRTVLPMRAKESEIGRYGAHELLEIVTRLKEVRRRFVRNAGGGDRFDHTEECLDSIILDLNEWLKPGGHPVELDDLNLRLAAVEEMIESLGFPGYAHVVASVRETLSAFALGDDPDDEDEPPAPRRFEPPPTTAVAPSSSGIGAAPGKTRAGVGRRRRGYGWLIPAVVAGGCVVAALAFGVFPYDGLIPGLEGVTDQIVAEEKKVEEPPPAPAADSKSESPPPEEPFGAAARTMGQLVDEIEAAEAALNDNDVDSALQHLAAAAAIDRHHRGVISLAKSLIDHLLNRADEVFDNTEWELACKRVDDARHLARGLYLDTSEIDQMARKHAALTRFDDFKPDDQDSIRRAVGHSVRVTLTTRKELFGRLETFEDNRLMLAIHSGVDGGGVSFSKEILLGEILELRVYEALRVSETVLDR